MLEEEILGIIDNYKEGYLNNFMELGHGYSFLVDCRLNIFRGDRDRWAIVGERLGYNPRAGNIPLEICYLGNCLQSQEVEGIKQVNHFSLAPYRLTPIDEDRFYETIDGEYLKEDALYWTIRGQQIELSHNLQDYSDAGIGLRNDEPGQISLEDVARLLVTRHRDLFRATDQELCQFIPADLKKILVLDEWYHRDFFYMDYPEVTDKHLMDAFSLQKARSQFIIPGFPDSADWDFESFRAYYRENEKENLLLHQNNIDQNRPAAYETWRLISKVIATGDPSFYKPTLKPNTHWINWPESGSL